MYKFDVKEKLSCGAREMFERSLSNFDEYVKFAPDVKKVDVLSRERRPDGREDVVINVFAKAQLPQIAKLFMKTNEMTWKEFYVIDLDNLSVEWKVETPIFTEYVDCRGASSSRDIPGGCEVHIKGDMKITPIPIKGIPPAVVQSAISIVEPFVGKMITFNLKKYFENVDKVMQKEKRQRAGAHCAPCHELKT